MKNSRYNIFIDRKSLVVCYNTFTDSMLVLKSTVYTDFINMPLDIFSSKHPSAYEEFIDKGFLVDDETDELAILKNNYEQNTHATRSRQLMIYPTQDCNLKCWYCYESHVKGSIMSEKTRNNIIKYVQKEIEEKKFDDLMLSFFGGEPLIGFNKIAYPLAYTIKELCEKNNIYFSTFFISNATLLNENIITKMKDINPHFQITLDGDRKKHDTVRIGKLNNTPTYDKIMKSIHMIVSEISNKNSRQKELIVLRINYDNDTLKNISSIINDISDINRNYIHIHLERVWQTLSQVDSEQIDLLIQAIRLFSSAGFYVKVGKFKRKDCACLAEMKDYAVINYNGLVYKCNGRNLTEKSAEGRLDENGNIIWDEQCIAQRMHKPTFDNPKCLQCKMLPLCMGPCSQKCMELGWENLNKACLINLLDFSLEQYILLECETRWKYLKYKNNTL